MARKYSTLLDIGVPKTEAQQTGWYVLYVLQSRRSLWGHSTKIKAKDPMCQSKVCEPNPTFNFSPNSQTFTQPASGNAKAEPLDPAGTLKTTRKCDLLVDVYYTTRQHARKFTHITRRHSKKQPKFCETPNHQKHQLALHLFELFTKFSISQWLEISHCPFDTLLS